MIYYSLFYPPHLLYSIPIWGNSDQTQIKPFFILQKKTLILNKHRNATPIFQLSSSTAILIFSQSHFVDTFVNVHSDPIFNKLEMLKVKICLSFLLLNLCTSHY